MSVLHILDVTCTVVQVRKKDSEKNCPGKINHDGLLMFGTLPVLSVYDLMLWVGLGGKGVFGR